MGGIFKKKLTPEQEMVRVGVLAFKTECPARVLILKSAEIADIHFDEDQDAGLDFELVVFQWLSLIKQSFGVDARSALDPLATSCLHAIIKENVDTPRLNKLRRGARWLYRVNDEGTAARLWVTVNVDNLPEDHWRDFSIQVLSRLFAHMTVMNSNEPEDRMVQAMAEKTTIRLYPNLSDKPFNLQTELKNGMAAAIAAIMRMKTPSAAPAKKR